MVGGTIEKNRARKYGGGLYLRKFVEPGGCTVSVAIPIAPC